MPVPLIYSAMASLAAFFSYRETVASRSIPNCTVSVMSGHSTIYSVGTRSCMAVPLLTKESITGAMTFVGAANAQLHQT